MQALIDIFKSVFNFLKELLNQVTGFFGGFGGGNEDADAGADDNSGAEV